MILRNFSVLEDFAEELIGIPSDIFPSENTRRGGNNRRNSGTIGLVIYGIRWNSFKIQWNLMKFRGNSMKFIIN